MPKKNNTNELTEYEMDILIKKETTVGIVLLAVFIFLLIIYILLISFTVTNVYVEGNEHYTAAQIRRMVENSWYGDNSLFLAIKYRNKDITGIPFIEKMDVNVVNRNTIKIMVYEKTLAGYVEYLGDYIYFDKDGVVVESSKVRSSGIPLVTGLTFDHFVMYEQLPVENPDVFQTVLDVTQLLKKYEITPDRIYFNDKEQMTLYFDNIRVGLGETKLLEEKIQRLDAILPSLEGKSGYLEMSTYDNGNDNFTFTND